jgi:hypothetical protein
MNLRIVERDPDVEEEDCRSDSRSIVLTTAKGLFQARKSKRLLTLKKAIFKLPSSRTFKILSETD